MSLQLLRHKLLVCAVVLGGISAGYPLQGQDQSTSLYQWYTIGVNGRISSKWSMSFMRQYSRPNEKKALFDYYLDDFRVSRGFGKHWDIFGGVSYLLSDPMSDEPNFKRRYVLGVGYQMNILKGLRFSARLTAERHLQENRYDGRGIAMLRLDYTKLDLWEKIGVRPFVIGQLYYYAGGDWIRQYDQHGTFVMRSPTYGWHRARARAGLAISSSTWYQFSIFYMLQREFNTRHAQVYHHQINEINPITGKVSRSFDNYQAWGLGLTFFISARKKSKQKPEADSSLTD